MKKTVTWTRRPGREDDRPDEKRFSAVAPGIAAGNVEFDDALKVEGTVHYNGSGPQAFGGAKKWPVAKLEVAFPEGAYDKRDQFIADLQTFLTEYFTLRRKSK